MHVSSHMQSMLIYLITRIFYPHCLVIPIQFWHVLFPMYKYEKKIKCQVKKHLPKCHQVAKHVAAINK